jgi:hypothetical protein
MVLIAWFLEPVIRLSEFEFLLLHLPGVDCFVEEFGDVGCFIRFGKMAVESALVSWNDIIFVISNIGSQEMLAYCFFLRLLNPRNNIY